LPPHRGEGAVRAELAVRLVPLVPIGGRIAHHQRVEWHLAPGVFGFQTSTGATLYGLEGNLEVFEGVQGWRLLRPPQSTFDKPMA
jgi:hypothetical protein